MTTLLAQGGPKAFAKRTAVLALMGAGSTMLLLGVATLLAVGIFVNRRYVDGAGDAFWPYALTACLPWLAYHLWDDEKRYLYWCLLGGLVLMVLAGLAGHRFGLFGFTASWLAVGAATAYAEPRFRPELFGRRRIPQNLREAYAERVTWIRQAQLDVKPDLRPIAVEAWMGALTRPMLLRGRLGLPSGAALDDLRDLVHVANRVVSGPHTAVNAAAFRAVLRALIADWENEYKTLG